MSNSTFHSLSNEKIRNDDIRHQTPPSFGLCHSWFWTRSIIFVEDQNAIICVNTDRSIQVYDLRTKGKLMAVCKSQNSDIFGIAQLDDNLVISVSDLDKSLLTWRVSDTYQIGKWVHTERLSAIAKLEESQVIVGDCQGGLVILNHNNGTSLQLKKTLSKKHSRSIECIAVHRNIFVTCPYSKAAVVWDTKSFKPIATLNHNAGISAVAINHKYIITTTFSYELYVFEAVPNFNLSQVFQISHRANNIQFLDDDILALACDDGFFDFISLSQKSYISRCKLSNKDLLTFALLPNAQIAVGGGGEVDGPKEGFSCIFTPPYQVFNTVQTCVSRLYPSFSAMELFLQKTQLNKTGGDSCTSASLLVKSSETSTIGSHSDVGAASSLEITSEFDLFSELRRLEGAGLDKAAIRTMNSFEIASTLSGFLVMYKACNTQRFAKLRHALENKFNAKSIKGRTFVHPSDAIRAIISKNVENALAQVVEQDDLELLSILLNEFLELMS